MTVKVMSQNAPTVQLNPLTILQIGGNDVGQYGTDPTLQSVYVNTLENSIAWSAIPDAGKLLTANTSQCTYTGTWTHPSAGGLAVGFLANDQTVVAGSAMSCNFTLNQPGPIYISYLQTCAACVAAGSGFTVTVDGVAAGSFL
jgi:hypothetical protein